MESVNLATPPVADKGTKGGPFCKVSVVHYIGQPSVRTIYDPVVPNTLDQDMIQELNL